MLLEEILVIKFKNQRSKLGSESGRNRKMFPGFFYLNSKAMQPKGTMISV